MKTVVVPDVHQKIGLLNQIIDREGEEAKYVFLSDWFDDFGDSPECAARMASWLQDRMEKRPGDVFLLGNHDAWYLWPRVGRLACSGNSAEKLAAIRAHLDVRSYVDRVKLWHEENGWLISHAGLSRDHFNEYCSAVNEFGNSLDHDRAKKEVVEASDGGRIHPLLAAGRARLGSADRGGVTWLDWDREFETIAGVNQIVGHTAADTPRRIDEFDLQSLHTVSTNWCIDSHLKHYATIDERGMLLIEENG